MSYDDVGKKAPSPTRVYYKCQFCGQVFSEIVHPIALELHIPQTANHACTEKVKGVAKYIGRKL